MNTLKAYVKWFHLARARFGGDTQARQRSISWLLNQEELPGSGWVIIDQGSWRVGVGGKTDITRRARQAGKMLAVRSFTHRESTRWLWIEVLPLASTTDAQWTVPELHRGFVPNPMKVKVLHEGKVASQNVPEVAEPWFYEQRTFGRLGPGTGKFIGGNIADVVFLVASSGRGDGWPWEDVIAIASAQAVKLKRALENT